MIPGVPCRFGTRLLAEKNGPVSWWLDVAPSLALVGLFRKERSRTNTALSAAHWACRAWTHETSCHLNGGACRLSGETGQSRAMAGARNLWRRPVYLSEGQDQQELKSRFHRKVSSSHLRSICRVRSTFRDVGCKLLILSLKQFVREV